MFVVLLSLLAFKGDTCSFEFETWRQPGTGINVVTFVACLNAGPLDLCPVADAGSNQVVGLGSMVSLDGTLSMGVGMEEPSYQWRQVDNGAPSVSLENAASSNASFLAEQVGTYVFELFIADACRSAIDQTVVTVEDVVAFPQEVQLALIANVGSLVVEAVSAGDDRLFIVQKSGVVRIFQDGVVLPTPFMDISDVVRDSGEQGLLGLAFDPDYATNGFLYVNYVGNDLDGSGSSSSTRIAAFEVSADPNVVDVDSGNVLLTVAQPASNHNGGQVVFGPDGMLYISLGDGGGANDQFGHGQNTESLLATLLRLEVSGPDQPYAIPADNPFAGNVPGFLPEIWAYGLRNPWRVSFDSVTGELYIADVGQNSFEEVNVQPADSSGGENYGWPIKEGFDCFTAQTELCEDPSLTDPVFDYGRSLGQSITGGYVYRGSNFPALQGFYIVADFSTSNFWLLKRDGAAVWQSNLTDFTVDGFPFSPNITGFGQDSQGEVYVCTANGQIYEIVNVVP